MSPQEVALTVTIGIIVIIGLRKLSIMHQRARQRKVLEGMEDRKDFLRRKYNERRQ